MQYEQEIHPTMNYKNLRILIWGINKLMAQMKSLCQKSLDTASWNGLETQFLGIGHEFIEHRQRLWILRDELRKMNNDDIVLCMDGSDTLFNATSHEIYQKFIELDTKIVISAERTYVHQYPKFKRVFDEWHGPYKYVNAGTFMGYAGALLQLFEDLITLVETYPQANDQGLLGIWLSKHIKENSLVKLDYHCELFWVTSSDHKQLAHEVTTYQTIFNPFTKSKPAILHITGNQDPTIGKIYNEAYNCLRHIHSIEHYRIIVLSPIINNSDYRLWKEKKHQIDNDYPTWYTVRHPNIIMFFYGTQSEQNYNLISTDYVEEAIILLEEKYILDYIVHIPIGYSFETDNLFRDISNFYSSEKIKNLKGTDFIEDQKFIYHNKKYYRYSGLNKNLNQFIPWKESKPYDITNDWIEPISIGGWCGPALTLNDLKIRKIAYPFCFIHSTISCIHEIIKDDTEVFFREGEYTLFPHHNLEKKEERLQFENRIEKFINRLSEPKPLMFIRTIISQDYKKSITEIRQIKNYLFDKYSRSDKFLVIIHDQNIRTVHLGMPYKDIMIWTAEGQVGWNIPDRDTIFDSYARIIQYALEERNWLIENTQFKLHSIKEHTSWGICKELYPC